MTKYFVEIVKREPREVDTRMKAHNQRDAEKIQRGANINLNHKRYFTRIVSETVPEAE